MDLPPGFSLSMPGAGMRVSCACGEFGSAVPTAGWQVVLGAWVEAHECEGSADGDAGSE